MNTFSDLGAGLATRTRAFSSLSVCLVEPAVRGRFTMAGDSGSVSGCGLLGGTP